VLTLMRRRYRDRNDEAGFTVVEVTIASAMLLVVLAMFFDTLISLTRSEDRSQRLVSNEQNVRFELDQLARDVRAANPMVPLRYATTAAAYNTQIEIVLGPTGGTQQVIRWLYDGTSEQLVRQVMSSTASNATVVSQSFVLSRVRNVETVVPVFTYFGQQNEDLVAQSIANGDTGGMIHDAANCAVRVHMVITSDSNPGPVPFTETQDVEIRNRLPGNVGCG
jgi:type II secretory pathway pseudopilin PulG